MNDRLNLQQPHPFMTVRREQFDGLRKKAEQSPWKEMKRDALKRFHELHFYLKDTFVLRCNSVRDIADAAALVYILEPTLKEECIRKLTDVIHYWKPDVSGNLYDEMYHSSGDHWIGAIPPGAAFSSCLLALDILYDELTAEQRLFCEQTLEAVAENYIRNDENHMVAILGVRGLWALYTGQRELLFRSWEAWKELFMGYLTEDGAGVMSIDYSIGRFVRGDRISKIILPIVMDFTGLDQSFYSNQKVISFVEWALGYTYTPTKDMWLIGDTLLCANMREPESMHLIYEAARYSQTAAAFAARLMQNRTPCGKLLNYLLLKEDFVNPCVSESRIFKDGGAWFYENMEDHNSMAGLLWNSTVADGHGHKEINSVNLAAYGSHLYVNAGYSGWGWAAEDFTWHYINQSALSANTVLVDYAYNSVFDPEDNNDHCRKSGAGITEGFLSAKLSYALGDSGNALPNAVHKRGFVMVAGEKDAPGYFLLLDSVDAGSKMTVVHRPFSDTYRTEQENTEYVWNITEHVGLSVFLATPPSDTEIINGIVADRVTVLNENFTERHGGRKIKSLLASYPAEALAATLLFPFDGTHPKPLLQRTDCGMRLLYPHCEDLILTKSVCGGETEFCGTAAVARRTANGCVWFFAQHATKFSCKNLSFGADKPISLFFDGMSGVYTAQTDVRLTLPANFGQTLRVGDASETVYHEQNGKISCVLPVGTHSITLIQ